MAGSATAPPPVKASGVRWDLSALHHDAAEARAAMTEVLTAAARFQARYRDRVERLSAAELAGLLDELGRLTDRIHTSLGYAELRLSVDSALPENQDLGAAADQAGIDFDNCTRFFRLEWQALPPARAAALSAAPELAGVRHWLERLSQLAPHSLSAEAESALAERSPAAVSGWQQLFSQTTSAITPEFAPPGGPAAPHTIDELINFRYHPDPEVRRRALDTLYGALEPWAPVLAKAYDALVGDRLAIDRLRGFTGAAPERAPLPMRQANLSNDLSDQVVDTLIREVGDHYPVAQRYFAIKARVLGLPKLSFYDLLAPLGEVGTCPFPEGQALVLDALGQFSEEARDLLARFFTERLIDAEPRAGKRGGAFCESVARDRPSYVSLNYTDSVADAVVLAHELGHGLHAVLAKRAQPSLTFESGLAMAEVASTFNELLLFDHLRERGGPPSALRRLVSSRVERSCNTIFNQVMMARYEQRAYAAKAAGESLNPTRLGAAWTEEATRYYGDRMEFPEGYRFAWSYIPHFISTRFYTYSYSFAHLTSLALYALYLEDRAAFVPRYLELLSAGGSRSPEALLSELGIEIRDPAWVEPAFSVVSSWIDLVDGSAG